MKKNVLFIVIDSVTNDVLFNKNNSKDIAPFMNLLRTKSVSGDKMYSEAPYTEAALMSLLGSIDTMDNGGYLERMKNTRNVLEDFKENGYKTFFCNYYPSIYPSYMVNGYTERKYIDGFHFSHIWGYRFEYYGPLYLEGKTTKKENNMLLDMLEDNFEAWIEYLEKIKNKDAETTMLNDCVDTKDIDKNILLLKKEYNKFKDNEEKYITKLFKEKEEHILFKINEYKMSDKIRNDEVRNQIMTKYTDTFKRIQKLNLTRNIKNNKFPFSKTINSILKKDLKTAKGLLAGYKNSLFDKDLYERIEPGFDMFKDQRSFRTVSNELIDWISKNKDETWMSYVHIDDAHYTESFFTYDTTNIEIVDDEFKKINEYLDKLPKDYKGSIAYDLSLMYCDNIIKNIFNYLEKENLLDNTNVVITADHGFSYYFSPVRERYVISNYKENYNVPFIVYGKDVKPRKIKGYCSTKDIPVTLLSLAGIKKHKDYKGNNLLAHNGDSYAMLEYMGGGCPDILRRPINLGIKTDNYSVTVDAYVNKNFDDIEIKEVYNLKKDPSEHKNINKKNNVQTLIKEELEILNKRFLEIQKQYKGVNND